MAKKQTEIPEVAGRQTRKEELRARKQQQQLRQVKIAVGIVLGLLVLVVLVGVITEFFIVPNRAVATVDGEPIALRDWQERVVFERAQRIIFLENQYEAFAGDVGIIQQFAGQTIVDLQSPEVLAQDVLDSMVDETVIRQEAEARGITVTDADVDARIAEQFNFFGGESPTPVPTGTATAVPTPSLTPIPTPVITDVVPTSTPFPTPTPGPTSTPQPTPTPVTEAAFEEELGDFYASYADYGIDETLFREAVRNLIYRERLLDALADEIGLATRADANEALALIESEGYLPIWNQVRSTPTTSADAPFPGATANEYLWRTEDGLTSLLGAETAAAAFELGVGDVSDVLVQTVEEGDPTYRIIQVSGREERDLAASVVEQAKEQLLTALVDAQVAETAELTESWRSRVPTRPLLDPKFLAQPTAAPTQPGDSVPLTVPTVAP